MTLCCLVDRLVRCKLACFVLNHVNSLTGLEQGYNVNTAVQVGLTNPDPNDNRNYHFLNTLRTGDADLRF